MKATGNSQFWLDVGARISTKEMLITVLSGDTQRITAKFTSIFTRVVRNAIGTLEAGLWPPKTPIPVLVIHDNELCERCADLLRAPSNYDRVIREATTVLEDRIKHRVPSDVLAQRIPHIKDQTGDNLVNQLFSPDRPVLSISDDKTVRIALHRILLGVVSYLRNPYHHTLDDKTEWSWAWSAVGLIDRLLSDVEVCQFVDPNPSPSPSVGHH